MLGSVFKYLSIVILLSVTACAKHTTVRQNPSFSTGMVKQKEVIVLPSDAVVNTVDFYGKKERMYDYEYHLEGLINKALVTALKERGYRVISMSRKELHENGAAKPLVRLKGKYEEEIKKLYEKPLLPEAEAFAIENSIGRHEIDFKTGRKDVLLVIADYASDVKTGGARARDFMIGALLNNNSISAVADSDSFIVSIVDITTGKVLWSHAFYSQSDIYSDGFKNAFSSREKIDQAKVDKIVTGVLKELKDRESKT